MSRIGLLKQAQLDNLEYMRNHQIHFCDARRHIPIEGESADVVYTSHMVEHLDIEEAAMFFREATRVLVKSGTIRLALPNLEWHVKNYLAGGDAETFMDKTKLGRMLPKSFFSRAKVFFLGEREYHVWMYDESSAVRLLERAGFADVRAYPPGETRIHSPAPLDLAERSPESLFVEGTKK